MYRLAVCAAVAAVASADVGGCDEKEAILEFQNDRFNALNPYVSTSALTPWFLPPKHVENQQYCTSMFSSLDRSCTEATCEPTTQTMRRVLEEPMGAAGVEAYCNFRQDDNNGAAVAAMLKQHKGSYASSHRLFDGAAGDAGRAKTGKPEDLKMSKGMTGVYMMDVVVYEPVEVSSVDVIPHHPDEMVVGVHVTYREEKKLADIDHDAVEEMVKDQIFGLAYKHDYFGSKDTDWTTDHVKHLGTRFQPAVKTNLGYSYMYWYSTNFAVANSVKYDMLMPAVVTHDGSIDKETFLTTAGEAATSTCADVLADQIGWYTQCISHPVVVPIGGGANAHSYVAEGVNNGAENLIMHTGSCQKSCQSTVPPAVPAGDPPAGNFILAYANDKFKCISNGLTWTTPDDEAANVPAEVAASCTPANPDAAAPVDREKVDYPIDRGDKIAADKNPELTVWIEGATLPPTCTFMNSVRGTNETKNSPSECSLGCGGRHEPRSLQVLDVLSLFVLGCTLLHTAMRIVTFFRSTGADDKASDGTMTRTQHKVLLVVIVVVVLHVIIATMLQWSSSNDCIGFLAKQNSLRDALSSVSWIWPSSGFTTQSYMWLYALSIIISAAVAIIASTELLNSNQTIAMVEQVLSLFPAMMYVSAIIFVASGTYGAMSNGRHENADGLAGYWRGEAFYINEKILGHTSEGPINGSLRASAWLMVTAFIVISVLSAIVIPYLFRSSTGEFGVSIPQGEFTSIAAAQMIFFPVAGYMCRVAVKAHKYVNDAWGHDNGYAQMASVRDYCASASFIEDTISHNGTVALIVMTIIFTTLLGVAWAIMAYHRMYGVTEYAARHARTVSVFSVAVLTPIMLFMFAPQKLSVCATLPIPPVFAVLAPIAIATGIYILCKAMVEQIRGKPEAAPMVEEIEMATISGYFGGSAM